MVDAIAIQSAVTSLKTALDIYKTVSSLNKSTEFAAKMSELRGEIIAAQSSALDALMEQTTLIQRIDELKKEIMRFEQWEAQSQRYQLHQVATGVLAYKLKEGAQPPEPDHYACPNCYGNRHISILQEERRMPGGMETLICHHCGADTVINGPRHMDATTPRSPSKPMKRRF